MVKIGIIGAGFIGDVHAQAYNRIENAQLVGIVNRTREKGEKFAEKYGIKFYPTMDELLESEDIDAVDICTPTHLHLEMVKKAANAGKNILCEKPLALSVEDAEEMISIVKEKKVKAMVGHVLRFWPEYVRVKEIIDKRELGKPLFATCARLAVSPDWRNWGFKEELSGGVTMDLQIHDIDYLIWLFGIPKSVRSQGYYNKELGGWAHVGILFNFDDNVSGMSESGWAFKGSFPFTMLLRILCEKGTIDWTFKAGKNIEERGKEFSLTIYKPDGSVEIPEMEKEDPFYLELKYFIDCIENNTDIERATLEDGKNTLLVTLSAIKSLKENSIVYL
ncbi:MAG: hypothetical protein DRP54_02040 [Spirochaetes bacterium]|nr:MAG: hypothetical protein DRP54_02040 [Spirochaetota bacterium]